MKLIASIFLFISLSGLLFSIFGIFGGLKEGGFVYKINPTQAYFLAGFVALITGGIFSRIDNFSR